MIKAGKIIEMNAEELEQISGGSETNAARGINSNLNGEWSDDQIKKANMISKVGGVIGAVSGIAAGMQWINEAKKSGNNIGFWGKAWRIVITMAGGSSLVATASAGAYLGGALAKNAANVSKF